MHQMSGQTDRGSVEQRGLELAGQIEASVHGEQAAAVVLAGCWLLATVIVQAVEDTNSPADMSDALSAVTKQLFTCVLQLQELRQATKQ